MAIKSRNLHTMGFFGKMWRSGPGPPPRDVAVEQPGAELPAHSLGPRLFFKDDGTEFVSQEEQGLAGLLGRIIQVPEHKFLQHVERANQLQLASDINKGLNTWLSRSLKSIFGLPTIHPSSGFTRAWMSIISLLDLVYTGFWVPMNVAFCSTSYGDLSSPCTKSDLTFGVIYALHLLVNFQVGINLVHGYRKRVILDGFSVAGVYIRYGRFWLDFVTALPFVYLIVIVAGNIAPTRWVAIVSLCRLVRMSRLVSLGNTIFMDAQRGEASSRFIRAVGGSGVAYTMIVLIGIATIMNLEACMLVLVAQFSGKENSWMASRTWEDLIDAPDVYQWYSAMYVTIASNTQTGLAGIYFQTYSEWAIMMVMQLIGMTMFTIVVTVGVTSMTRISKHVMRMHQLGLKMKKVHKWLRHNSLPDRMAKQILAFYYESWVKRNNMVREDEVVAGMPRFLRSGLLRPLTSGLIDRVHYLPTCEAVVRGLVAESLVPVDVMPGVELCAEGEPPSCCWILGEGSVLAVNMKGQSQVLSAPCLFGESLIMRHDVAACNERLWSYHTMAGREEGLPVKLWRLHAQDIAIITRCYPELRTGMLQYVQGKLIFLLARSYVEPGAFPGAEHVGWCELAERITLTLRLQPEYVQDDVRAQLGTSSHEDGSLQLLLDALIEVAVLNKSDARVLSEALAEPTTVVAARTNMANRRSIERAVSVHYAAVAAASSTGGGAPAGGPAPVGRASLDATDLRGSNRRRFSFSEAASQMMMSGAGKSFHMLDQVGSTPGALQALGQTSESQGGGQPGVTRGLSGLGEEGGRDSAASIPAGWLPAPSGSQVPNPLFEGASSPQMEELLGFGSAISVWPRKTTGEAPVVVAIDEVAESKALAALRASSITQLPPLTQSPHHRGPGTWAPLQSASSLVPGAASPAGSHSRPRAGTPTPGSAALHRRRVIESDHTRSHSFSAFPTPAWAQGHPPGQRSGTGGGFMHPSTINTSTAVASPNTSRDTSPISGVGSFSRGRLKPEWRGAPGATPPSGAVSELHGIPFTSVLMGHASLPPGFTLDSLAGAAEDGDEEKEEAEEDVGTADAGQPPNRGPSWAGGHRRSHSTVDVSHLATSPARRSNSGIGSGGQQRPVTEPRSTSFSMSAGFSSFNPRRSATTTTPVPGPPLAVLAPSSSSLLTFGMPTTPSRLGPRRQPTGDSSSLDTPQPAQQPPAPWVATQHQQQQRSVTGSPLLMPMGSGNLPLPGGRRSAQPPRPSMLFRAGAPRAFTTTSAVVSFKEGLGPHEEEEGEIGSSSEDTGKQGGIRKSFSAGRLEQAGEEGPAGAPGTGLQQAHTAQAYPAVTGPAPRRSRPGSVMQPALTQQQLSGIMGKPPNLLRHSRSQPMSLGGDALLEAAVSAVLPHSPTKQQQKQQQQPEQQQQAGGSPPPTATAGHSQAATTQPAAPDGRGPLKPLPTFALKSPWAAAAQELVGEQQPVEATQIPTASFEQTTPVNPSQAPVTAEAGHRSEPQSADDLPFPLTSEEQPEQHDQAQAQHVSSPLPAPLAVAPAGIMDRTSAGSDDRGAVGGTSPKSGTQGAFGQPTSGSPRGSPGSSSLGGMGLLSASSVPIQAAAAAAFRSKAGVGSSSSRSGQGGRAWALPSVPEASAALHGPSAAASPRHAVGQGHSSSGGGSALPSRAQESGLPPPALPLPPLPPTQPALQQPAPAAQESGGGAVVPQPLAGMVGSSEWLYPQYNGTGSTHPCHVCGHGCCDVCGQVCTCGNQAPS